MSRRGTGGIGLAALAALASGCRSPTEVTLELTTDVPCASFSGAAIAVGVAGDVETKAPATTTSTCTAEGTLTAQIGSLVIVPSGSDDAEIVIRVAGGVGRDPETCGDTGDATGCIVSRRAVRFIEHTPLVLDVPLRSACNGVVCAIDQTCVAGACASDVVPSGCGESGRACGESALDGGSSGAVVADDGGSGVDATVATSGGPGRFDGGPLGDATADATGSDAGDGGLLFGACADGTEPGAIWPGIGHCAGRDNRSPYVGVTAGNVGCAGGSGSPALTPLAIDADRTVYMGSSAGSLVAYDASLVQLFSFDLKAGAVTGAVIVSETTLWVTAGNSLFRFDRTIGGGEAASNPIVEGAPMLAPLLLPDGIVVTGSGAELLAFGAAFPTTAWTFGPPSQPALQSFAYGAGTPLYSAWSIGPMYTTPPGGAGSVALGAATEGQTNVLAGPSLAYGWNTSGITEVGGPTVALAGIVGVALTKDGLAVTSNPAGGGGALTLLDAADLQPRGTPFSFHATVTSAPVVDRNDTVYFTTNDAMLHVHTALGSDDPYPATGASTGGIGPTPMIGDGVVFVGVANGFCTFR